jgi:hypothetical protein
MKYIITQAQIQILELLTGDSEVKTLLRALKPITPMTDEEITGIASTMFFSHNWPLCKEFARELERHITGELKWVKLPLKK